MNRNQKIVVSMVGIIIVLLALLGITYAYYLTRIEGNTNTNSISITTADLKLAYSDGNGLIETSGVMPGDSITKTFSVENTGENKVNGYTIVLEDVVNELSRREDLKYSLYCKYDDGTSCGKSENNLYPKTSNIAIIYSNDINSKDKHNYELIVNYIYLDNVNQSDDMGSNISGKINIYDAKDDKLNPFKTGVSAIDNKSLAYNIIENARLGKNGTNLTGTPLTKVAEAINGETESVLSLTTDDYGVSYYFRGNVKDNYINFADMCWRIVRIDGLGNIKLVLEDQDNICEESNGNWDIPLSSTNSQNKGHYGYRYYDIGELVASDGSSNNIDLYIMRYINNNLSSGSMVYAFKNFQNTFTEEEKLMMINNYWCLNDFGYTRETIDNKYKYTLISETEKVKKQVTTGSFYYDSYVRLFPDNLDGYNPTYKCNGQVMSYWDTNNTLPMYVSALTADEIVFAGGKVSTNNPNYYLINDYHKNNSLYFWLLNPSYYLNRYDVMFRVNSNGYLGIRNVHDNNENKVSFRPSILLNSTTLINSGEGIKNNPYVLD